jgi:hypothetical protein
VVEIGEEGVVIVGNLVDLGMEFGDLRLEGVKIGQKLLTFGLSLFFLGDFVVEEIDKI